MTIEYIRYKLAPEESTHFVQAYKKAADQLDASEFCKAYELSECEEEPGVFVLRIEWASTQDHLEGFRKSAAFRDFFTHIKPFFNNILEMRHYQLTEVVNRK